MYSCLAELRETRRDLSRRRLAPSTTYSNVSVLTTSKNHILLNPLFILPDYDMMWRTVNV